MKWERGVNSSKLYTSEFKIKVYRTRGNWFVDYVKFGYEHAVVFEIEEYQLSDNCDWSLEQAEWAALTQLHTLFCNCMMEVQKIGIKLAVCKN